MKKRSIWILCTVCIVVFVFGMFFFSDRTAPEKQDVTKGSGSADLESGVAIPQEENYQVVKKYVEIRHTAAALASAEPEGQMYGQLYSLVESLKYSGMGEEVFDEAKKRYTEDCAILWYAEKHGLLAEEKQIKAYLDTMEEACGTAENGEEYAQACGELGLTFRQWMEEDLASYQLICTIQNVYDAVTAEEEAGSGDGKTADVMWETFQKENLKEYLQSDAYKTMLPDMDAVLKRLQ